MAEANKTLNVSEGLTALDINAPDLDHLTAEALKDQSVGGDPVEMNAENTRAFLEACL